MKSAPLLRSNDLGIDRQRAPAATDEWERTGPPARYAGSSLGNRSLAITLAIAIHATVATGLLIKWGHDQWVAADPVVPVATFDITAAPPEPVNEVPEGPEQVERQEQKPEERQEPPIEVPPSVVLPLTRVSPAPRKPEPAKVATDPVAETTAPKSLPAPPAPQVSSKAEASWESRLLAHLESFRRYPASARARRQQGISHIRFTITCAGKLVSTAMVRSSGSSILDRAAIATVNRADPFPEPPPDMCKAPIELVVPVEFFLR